MKTFRFFLFGFFFILLIQISTFSQNSDHIQSGKHTISLENRFCQYKDQDNYGLVYNGIGFLGKYMFSRTSSNHFFTYSSRLGFDISYKKGVALSIVVLPIDLYYGRKLNINDEETFLGGYFSMNYSWQLYPYLQTAHFKWLSSNEIGPRIIFKPIDNYTNLKVWISNSVFGFLSRPVKEPESYFYEFSFVEFIRQANSNMKAATFNTYNHTDIQIELEKFIRKKTTLVYQFEYFGYYKPPKYQMLSHSLILKWNL